MLTLHRIRTDALNMSSILWKIKTHQKVFTWFFLSRVFLIWSTAACEILFFLKCNTFSGGVQVISDVAPVSSIKLALRSILSNYLKTKQMIQNKMFIFTKWCHVDKTFISTEMIYHRHDTSLTKSLHKKQTFNNAFHLDQGFPTFSDHVPLQHSERWAWTPSAFQQTSMYPFSIATNKHVSLQHFNK